MNIAIGDADEYRYWRQPHKIQPKDGEPQRNRGKRIRLLGSGSGTRSPSLQSHWDVSRGPGGHFHIATSQLKSGTPYLLLCACTMCDLGSTGDTLILFLRLVHRGQVSSQIAPSGGSRNPIFPIWLRSVGSPTYLQLISTRSIPEQSFQCYLESTARSAEQPGLAGTRHYSVSQTIHLSGTP